MRTVVIMALISCVLACFSGCAVGSATAAYALQARIAEGLTPAAEQRLTERIMQDVKQWHESK